MRDYFFILTGSIRDNLFRSFLTALGIMFGVAAVIAMLSIGEGAKKEVMDQIKLLGLSTIIIENSTNEDEDTENSIFRLSLADYTSLKKILNNYMVSFEITGSGRGRIINSQEDFDIIGVPSNYIDFSGRELVDGRFIDDYDINKSDNVCLLNLSSIRKYLLDDMVGHKIKIANQWFIVTGIVNVSKVNLAGISRNYEQAVFIPYTTFYDKISYSGKSERIDQLIIDVKNEKLVDQASLLIKRFFKRRYDEGLYNIIVPKEIMEQSKKTQNIFNFVMATIASISLIVGGIGIMNIMLANVMERRKEIGIRRAIGASGSEILKQFLFESAVISIIGAILGIISGIILSYLISGYAGWQTQITYISIIVSVFVAVSVGIIFGFIPAKKAAKMEVADALRYE